VILTRVVPVDPVVAVEPETGQGGPDAGTGGPGIGRGETASVDTLPRRVDLESVGARASLAELYAPPAVPWLRINSVLSIGGSVAGADGSSESLSSRADRLLLGVIRSLADVVLSGASSIRREGLHLPRTARLAIVTGTGELGNLRVPDDLEPGRLMVLCPPNAVPRIHREQAHLRAEVVPVGAGGERMPASGLLAALHSRGLARVVCEGGPTLATVLLRAGLVDELCLTTSPVLTAARSPLVPGSGSEQWPLELRQLLVADEGTLFARWFVRRD